MLILRIQYRVVVLYGPRRSGKTTVLREIDLIEERGGKLFGYEFKWSEGKKVKPPCIAKF